MLFRNFANHCKILLALLISCVLLTYNFVSCVKILNTEVCSNDTLPFDNGIQHKAPFCQIQVVGEQLKLSDCSNNTLRVFLYILDTSMPIRINCTATYMMTVVPTFEEGLPWVNNTRVTFQRFATNISDTSSYTYGVQILPDSIMNHTVKYDVISHSEKFLLRTSILIFYSNRNQKSPRLSCMSGFSGAVFHKTEHEINFHRLHFVDRSSLPIIHLPCITDSADEETIARIPQLFTQSKPFNSSTLPKNSFQYEKSMGYKINLTYISSEILQRRSGLMFACNLNEQQFCLFENILEKKTQAKGTSLSDDWKPGEFRKWLVEMYNPKLELTANGTASCSSKLFMSVRTHLTLWRNTVPESIKVMAYSATSRFSKNDTNVKVAEIQFPKKDYTSGIGEIECRDEKGIYPIMHGRFVASNDGDPRGSLVYKMLDGATERNRGVLCYLDDEDNVKLRSVSCSNPYQCNLIGPCLGLPDATELCGARVRDHPDCDVISLTRWKSIPELSKFTNLMKLKGCKTAQVSQSVFMCSSDISNSQHVMEGDFIGLDGKPYSTILDIEHDIPREAYIQVAGLDVPRTYFTNGTFQFSCQAHAFIGMENLVWYFEYKNRTILPIPKEATKDIPTKEDFLGNPIRVSNITLMDTQVSNLICYAPSWQTKYKWINRTLPLTIKDSSPPLIVSKTETLEINFKFQPSENVQSLTCRVSSFPAAKFEWFHDGERVADKFVNEISEVESRLEFFSVTRNMLGKYTCVVTNIAGQDSRDFFVVEWKENTLVILIISAIFLSLSFAFSLLTFFYIKYKKMQLAQAYEEFKNGKLNGKPEEALPYDAERFEISSRIRIDTKTAKKLGDGQFGVVFYGWILIEEAWKEVALKRPKRGIHFDDFLDFLKELKIMCYVQQNGICHENVVKLVGACTADLIKGKITIVTEYCEKGSLDKYLDEKRTEYSFNSLCDFQHSPTALQFFQIARGIAAGMEQLELLSVYHGDLAARNILLAADYVPKISDFGKSRRLYKDTSYKENFTKRPTIVPMLWMSPEACEWGEFSLKSDVWSFGITLWEMFSLGLNRPFANLEDYDINFFALFLRNGARPAPEAKYANPKIKQLIRDCLIVNQDERPSFANIRNRLRDMVHAHVSNE